MIPELKRRVAPQRARIKHIDAQARQLGMESEVFPEFESMADLTEALIGAASLWKRKRYLLVVG